MPYSSTLYLRPRLSKAQCSPGPNRGSDSPCTSPPAEGPPLGSSDVRGTGGAEGIPLPSAPSGDAEGIPLSPSGSTPAIRSGNSSGSTRRCRSPSRVELKWSYLFFKGNTNPSLGNCTTLVVCSLMKMPWALASSAKSRLTKSDKSATKYSPFQRQPGARR